MNASTRLVIAGDYRRELTEALVRLEIAAERFLRRLAEQIEYLRGAPTDIGLRWPAVVAAAEVKGSALTPKSLRESPGLVDDVRTLIVDKGLSVAKFERAIRTINGIVPQIQKAA